MGQLVERAVSTPTQEFTPNRPPHHHSDWSPTRIYMHFHLPPITLTINLTFQLFLHCGDRGILILQKFDILNFACCQIVPICSLISELFCFCFRTFPSHEGNYFLKKYLHGKERSWSKNKNSSEISEQMGTIWHHANKNPPTVPNFLHRCNKTSEQ